MKLKKLIGGLDIIPEPLSTFTRTFITPLERLSATNQFMKNGHSYPLSGRYQKTHSTLFYNKNILPYITSPIPISPLSYLWFYIRHPPITRQPSFYEIISSPSPFQIII